jgi:hypothetical protein
VYSRCSLESVSRDLLESVSRDLLLVAFLFLVRGSYHRSQGGTEGKYCRCPLESVSRDMVTFTDLDDLESRISFLFLRVVRAAEVEGGEAARLGEMVRRRPPKP